MALKEAWDAVAADLPTPPEGATASQCLSALVGEKVRGLDSLGLTHFHAWYCVRYDEIFYTAAHAHLARGERERGLGRGAIVEGDLSAYRISTAVPCASEPPTHVGNCMTTMVSMGGDLSSPYSLQSDTRHYFIG